jgi:hypothetical protein
MMVRSVASGADRDFIAMAKLVFGLPHPGLLLIEKEKLFAVRWF